MKPRRTLCALVAACVSLTAHGTTRPDSHAPISVMGDHTHEAGEWMFSYRFMHMDMQGNRDGDNSISPEEIVTTVPNRFANPPMMPPTLRVVPTDMSMQMHMLGVMYAPNDRVTLMGMANYVDKEMSHITFAGPAGTNRLGEFTTRANGFGDTSLSALIKLGSVESSPWHVNLGVSLPTGSVTQRDQILTPMNTRPTPRLPYPMQLGSGTFDLLGGLTYFETRDRWSWGAQWRSVLPLGENDEDYALGDRHELQSWMSYLASSHVSVSARLAYLYRGNIDGIDPAIMAPVQTADPDNQGMNRVDLGLGANFLLPGKRHRLALELTVPIHQDLDGPQLETDWQLTLGWQLAFGQTH